MPAITQIKMNSICCLRDLNNFNWKKLSFHLAGVKRGFAELTKKSKWKKSRVFFQLN